MSVVRILAVAPYEGLGEIIAEVAKEYAGSASVTICIGDLESGLEAARSIDINQYDVILSRGGTAELLSRELALPVVDTAPTILDVLRHIRMAKTMTNRYAIVAFPAIADIAKKVFSLMELEENVYVIESSDEAAAAIATLKNTDCELVIGDAIAVSLARESNINSILITSGKESVENAMDEAIRLNEMLSPLKKEVCALRSALLSLSNPVFSLSADGSVQYAFFPAPCPDRELLLDKARSLLSSVDEKVPFSVNMRTENGLWRLSGRCNTGVEAKLFFFYAEKRKSIFPDRKNPVQMMRVEEYLKDDSVTDRIGKMRPINDQAEKAGRKGEPVLISGEPGTPFEDILHTIIQSYGNKNSMLYRIHCGKLDSVLTAKLLDSEDSPLMDNGQIFIFDHADCVTDEITEAWKEFALATNVSKRNRIIYCSDGVLQESFTRYLLRSGTHCLYLPSLRERVEDIPALVGLYINDCNYATGRQVIGLSPDAMHLITEYAWPQNNEQLRHIIRQAFFASSGDLLLPENIEPGLYSNSGKNTLVTGTVPADLTGTLDEISIRIAKAVLKEEKGNHVRTAERLNISRSTLWRMLKDDKSE